ncbi:hypothetical protein I8H89_02120 [Candidatus Saccharibacteria bacterium]|nr:hypothetical protein [Candidatus Saccharibacteria bacterium]
MNTIIFDLKNTLLNETGEWLKGAQTALAATRSSSRRILYTMNEQWTYEQITRYPEIWQQFDQLMLVAKKRRQDFEGLVAGEVLVVGDSLTEELLFARELGYEFIRIQGEMPVDEIENFLKGVRQ